MHRAEAPVDSAIVTPLVSIGLGRMGYISVPKCGSSAPSTELRPTFCAWSMVHGAGYYAHGRAHMMIVVDLIVPVPVPVPEQRD